MNKTLNITLFALIGLTVCSAFIYNGIETFVTSGIIGLAVLKFIGVSFHFMELKHANVFWKASVLIFLALFSAVLIIMI